MLVMLCVQVNLPDLLILCLLQNRTMMLPAQCSLSLHSRKQFHLLVLVGTRQSVVELALERTRKEKYLGFANLCWSTI